MLQGDKYIMTSTKAKEVRAPMDDEWNFILFAFFNVIWATLYLETWKRRSSELAYKWGTSDQRGEMLKESRPLFKGKDALNDITGKSELYYPEWKRQIFRYFVTVPVISKLAFAVEVKRF